VAAALTGRLHEPAPEQRAAFIRFRDAVLAMGDDPSPANVERYLEASQALDESRKAASRDGVGHQRAA